MIRRPPRSTLFPYTRSSDLSSVLGSSSRHSVDLTRPEFVLDVAGALECHVVRKREAHAVYRLSHEHILARMLIESDRKSTRLNSSHSQISYAVFCLKKKNKK